MDRKRKPVGLGDDDGKVLIIGEGYPYKHSNQPRAVVRLYMRTWKQRIIFPDEGAEEIMRERKYIRCNDCDEIFPADEVLVEEYVDYLETGVFQRVVNYLCPYCDSDDLSEAFDEDE